MIYYADMLARNYRNFTILLVCLILVKLSFPFISTTLPITDDNSLYGVRLANYVLALRQGQWPVYWLPNAYYGFGYPFLQMFHGANLAGAVLMFVGLGVERSMNLIYLFSIWGAFVGMYLFSRRITKDNLISLAASIFYIGSGYFLMDIFVRGSIGEVTFLALLPWVMWLVKLRRQFQNWWYTLIFTPLLALFLMSHHLSVFMFAPILLIWWLIQPRLKIQEFGQWLLSIFAAIGLALFNWLPALIEKQYSVFGVHHSSKQWRDRFPAIKDLFFQAWGYGGRDGSQIWMISIGFLGWMIVVFSFLYFIKNFKRLNKKKELFFWFVIFALSTLLMWAATAPIWQASRFLPWLQFPWRLGMITLVSTVMIWIKANQLQLWPQAWSKYLASLIILIAGLQIIFWGQPHDSFSESVHWWLHHPTSTTSDNEQKPIWFDETRSLAFTQDIILRPVGYQLFLDGNKTQPNSIPVTNTEVKSISVTGTTKVYQITTTEPVSLIFKTMYYPGWEAFINEQSVPILYQDQDLPGRVIVRVPEGENQIVKISFTGTTWDRLISWYAQIIGVILYIVLVARAIYFKRVGFSKRK